MNGVEILSQNTIYETEMHWWILIVFASSAFVISLILSIIDWCEYGFNVSNILAIWICTAICSLIGLVFTFLTVHKTDVVDYIEYKVTIDDSVSMNEFLDKYEILGQEGEIYTVKERE